MDEARLREAANRMAYQVPYLTVADQIRSGRHVDTPGVAAILAPILRALLREVVEECTEAAKAQPGPVFAIRERFAWLGEEGA